MHIVSHVQLKEFRTHHLDERGIRQHTQSTPLRKPGLPLRGEASQHSIRFLTDTYLRSTASVCSISGTYVKSIRPSPHPCMSASTVLRSSCNKILGCEIHSVEHRETSGRINLTANHITPTRRWIQSWMLIHSPGSNKYSIAYFVTTSSLLSPHFTHDNRCDGCDQIINIPLVITYLSHLGKLSAWGALSIGTCFDRTANTPPGQFSPHA